MEKHNEQFILDEHFNKFFDERMNLIFTCQPATIVEFHVAENTVKVTLDKEGISLDDIPISLFGNPQSYITTPTLEAGTKGLLIFSKHDLNIWVGESKDPHAKNDFSKNNAFFLIGATNSQNLINYNTTAIEIRTNKAIQTFSKNNTEFNSEASIKGTATADIVLNAGGKISNTAGGNIEHNSGASIKGTAPTSIEYTAPKIVIKNSSTNEELFSLLQTTLSTIQTLAHELSLSKDTADQSLLTNSSEFSNLATQFETLANKFGGFR